MSWQLSFFDAAQDSARVDDTANPDENVAPDTSALRKARGAFFTPSEMVAFVTEWAIRKAGDAILEPSCGEAAFLLNACERLESFGATRADLRQQVHGTELHAPSAKAAASRLAERGFAADIRVGDF